ncbi:MAG: hypothetical protein DDT32_01583 [Syntrophomonadaceae bacterium]|nr:hypothetical protein [Bacillota bacterium]MBT9147817.1 hypothetical protein [Bacillota bacterium]
MESFGLVIVSLQNINSQTIIQQAPILQRKKQLMFTVGKEESKNTTTIIRVSNFWLL